MSVFLAGASSFAVLVFEGDSITVWPPMPTNYTTLESDVFAPYAVLQNLAVAGSTVATMNARAASVDAFYDASRAINVLSVFIGANDLTAGTSAATIFSQLKSYGLARKAVGWKVIVATTLPSNALACASGGCESARLSLNASIRGDSSFYDALADIGDTSTFMGNITNNSNGTYWDQPIPGVALHPTNPDGHALLAPYFQTALRSLIPVRP